MRFLGRFGRRADLEEEITAYRTVFRHPAAVHHVVPDLAEYCGVGRPLPRDVQELQRAAGRRDVWDRIQARLSFTEAEVYAMMKGEPIVRPENE